MWLEMAEGLRFMLIASPHIHERVSVDAEDALDSNPRSTTHSHNQEKQKGDTEIERTISAELILSIINTVKSLF